KKTELVYMGIEKDIFDPNLKLKKSEYRDRFGLDKNALVVTLPSRIIKRKGVMELLKSMTLLREKYKKVRLFLPGMATPFDQNFAKEVTDEIKRLDLDGLVVIPNFHIDYKLMPAVYAASDLIV